MYCSKCGTQLSDGARFCTKCGADTGGAEGAHPNRDTARDSTFEPGDKRAIAGHNLKEAISILYDMEQDIYATYRMIQQIDQRMSKLGIRYRINPPIKKEVNKQQHTGDIYSKCGAGGMIAGMLLGIFIGMSGQSSSGVFGFVDQIGGAIGGGFVGGIIGVIIGLVIASGISSKKLAEVEEELNEQFDKEYKKYQSDCTRQEYRIKQEMKEIESLGIVKNKLLFKINASRKQLRLYYDMVGIDEDYRNLVPIGYMKDYLRLGIATQLHGPNGLNYFIRQELRADMLQMTMEEISNKLSMLIEINKAAFGELVALNDKCDQIIQAVGQTAHMMAQNNQALQDLKETEEMNAYYNSRIAAEAEYRNRMDAICGRWS